MVRGNQLICHENISQENHQLKQVFNHLMFYENSPQDALSNHLFKYYSFNFMFSTKQNISEHFFSFAGVQRESKEDQEKERGKKKDGSDKATQSCSHGFSLRWQKLLGDPVCTGVTYSSFFLMFELKFLCIC